MTAEEIYETAEREARDRYHAKRVAADRDLTLIEQAERREREATQAALAVYAATRGPLPAIEDDDTSEYGEPSASPRVTPGEL